VGETGKKPWEPGEEMKKMSEIKHKQQQKNKKKDGGGSNKRTYMCIKKPKGVQMADES